MHRDRIARIRNLVLAVAVRVDGAIGPLGRKGVAHGSKTLEAGVLEAVPLACGHVATEWVSMSLVAVVGHAFAAGVVAGATRLEARGRILGLSWEGID